MCANATIKVLHLQNPNWRKNSIERQDQEIVANICKCNMCKNTIKITLFCITTRKAANGIKNIINGVNGQGLANNYDRQIQEQTYFKSTFVMLK